MWTSDDSGFEVDVSGLGKVVTNLWSKMRWGYGLSLEVAMRLGIALDGLVHLVSWTCGLELGVLCFNSARRGRHLNVI